MSEITKQFPLRLNEDLYNSLKGASHILGRSMNDIVADGLRAYLLEHREEMLDVVIAETQVKYREVLDRLK